MFLKGACSMNELIMLHFLVYQNQSKWLQRMILIPSELWSRNEVTWAENTQAIWKPLHLLTSFLHCSYSVCVHCMVWIGHQKGQEYIHFGNLGAQLYVHFKIYMSEQAAKIHWLTPFPTPPSVKLFIQLWVDLCVFLSMYFNRRGRFLVCIQILGQ